MTFHNLPKKVFTLAARGHPDRPQREPPCRAASFEADDFPTGHLPFLFVHPTSVPAGVHGIVGERPENAPDADWTPESVGFVVQAVLQGSFIFAKAKNGAEVARDNLAHLRRYLESLFPPAVKKE